MGPGKHPVRIPQRFDPSVLLFVAVVLMLRLGCGFLAERVETAGSAFGSAARYSPIIVSLVFVCFYGRSLESLGWISRRRSVSASRLSVAACLILGIFVCNISISVLLSVLAGAAFRGFPLSLGANIAERFLYTLPANFSEETAWRGFLYGRLSGASLHQRNLLIWAVWWVWHFPIQSPRDSRALVTFMLLLPLLLGASYVLSWLAETSGTIWRAVICHFAINLASGIAFMLVAASGSTGLALTIAIYSGTALTYGLAALVLWLRFPPTGGIRATK